MVHFFALHPVAAALPTASPIPAVGWLRASLVVAALLACAQASPGQQTFQCLKGDCHNGEGACVFPSGAKYRGHFQEGKLHGEGVLEYSNGDKYVGQWAHQRREGKGRMTFAHGDEYFGQFSGDAFHGPGELVRADGARYAGHWVHGKLQGEGSVQFPDGSRFSGYFKDGQRDGFGSLTWPNGDTYEGFWQLGMQHGKGKIVLHSGREIAGTWVYGQFQTDWEALTFQGDPSRLTDCAARPCHGYGKWVYPDGTRYYGTFRHGKPHGNARVVFPHGDIYEGEWQVDAPHGIGRMFYLTGQVVAAYWERGKLRRQLASHARALPNPPTGDGQPTIWAVLVGVAHYPHMPTLRYTDDDAYQLYAFLKSPEGGALPDRQLRVLIDEAATRENILGAIRQVFYRADADDIVLFYFSGHGLPGAFLPTDYDGKNNRLEHHELNRMLLECQAESKIILADACHAGTLSERKTPSGAGWQPFYDAFSATGQGTALMMSSRGEEYSLEDGGLRSGIFSHFLVRGLKGGADANGDRIVTLIELFQYVRREVRRYSGNLQTPMLDGNYLPDTPLASLR